MRSSYIRPALKRRAVFDVTLRGNLEHINKMLAGIVIRKHYNWNQGQDRLTLVFSARIMYGYMGRDSYGLDGLGFWIRFPAEVDFLLYKPALVSTQFSLRWVQGLFHRK